MYHYANEAGLKRENEEKKSPEAIGPIIEKVLSRLGLKELVTSSRVFHIWDSVVGPTIAQHAQPQALRKGTLIVHVDSSVWLSELDRYLKGRIREKLNKIVKNQLVDRIVFRIGEVDKSKEEI